MFGFVAKFAFALAFVVVLKREPVKCSGMVHLVGLALEFIPALAFAFEGAAFEIPIPTSVEPSCTVDDPELDVDDAVADPDDVTGVCELDADFPSPSESADPDDADADASCFFSLGPHTGSTNDVCPSKLFSNPGVNPGAGHPAPSTLSAFSSTTTLSTLSTDTLSTGTGNISQIIRPTLAPPMKLLRLLFVSEGLFVV
ncbi:hypothetical protein NLJ89_g12248 [Agrocybe chaxingu]|uniref:Uncharacterized protein n=1 Tax=Agrocybe chaxingu TaxID=84603 RepID=A0A9W8JKC7_9AGAR|nr:hypothetical protein NLJ89_g12248 [Agrocybe chaxingu]